MGYSTARVWRSDGKAYYFNLSGPAWVPEADVTDRLEQLKYGSGNPTGWRYTTSNDEVELYNIVGNLLSITNRDGHTQTLTYSDGSTNTNGGYVLDANGNSTGTVLPAGLLIRAANPSGQVLKFGYDARGRMVKVTIPDGNFIHYAFDALDNLTAVIYPDSTPGDLTDNPRRTYIYNEVANTTGKDYAHAITGIGDENNTRFTTYRYDTGYRAINSELGPNMAGGPVEQYGLSFGSNATTVTDPLGASRTYSFQVLHGLYKSTGTNQPGGSGCGPAASNMTYDANGNVKTRTDFNGNTTWYDYDLSRNLETVRIEAYATPLARTINTAWHPNFRLPTVITEPGRVTEMSYDPASGNLLTKKITSTADAKARQWIYTYTGAGDNTLPNLLKTVDGPRTDVSDITAYSYYPNGDLQSVTNALGHATQITSYDPTAAPEYC